MTNYIVEILFELKFIGSIACTCSNYTLAVACLTNAVCVTFTYVNQL